MQAGKVFETELFTFICSFLESGQLGLDPRFARAYLNKEYWSRERQASINVDISIEIQAPDTDQPLLIWIWECKDYTGLVPINDVEEFDAKLQQIGANNTKGTIITRTGFQRSAIEYARARKISLLRFVSPAELQFIGGDRVYSPASHFPTEAEIADKLLSTLQLETSVPLGALTSAGNLFIGVSIADFCVQGYEKNHYTAISLMSYIAREYQDTFPEPPATNCFCCGAPTPRVRLEIPWRSSIPSTFGCQIWRAVDVCWTCLRLIQATPQDIGGVFFLIAFVVPIAAVVTLIEKGLRVSAYVLLAGLILTLAGLAYGFLINGLCKWRMRSLSLNAAQSNKNNLVRAILKRLGVPGIPDVRPKIKRTVRHQVNSFCN